MTANPMTTVGFKDHFSSKSDNYAAYRPRYPAALADWLAQTAGAAQTALDSGCGNGQLSVLLASRFADVTATDASAAQIAAAEPHPRVRYRVAPAEASGMPDRSADLLTVAQAAHWFDLPAFYAEARRVLRPGGVLALITYGVTETDDAPGEIVARFYHQTLPPYWPPERRHVESRYRDLPFPFDELTPPVVAMKADWTLGELLGYIDTWSAARNLEKAHGRGPMEAFAAEMTAAWGDPAQRREIRWPLSMRTARL